MTSEYRRLLVFLLGIGAAGGLFYWALPRMLRMSGGPENEIIGDLKRTEKEGLSLDVAGSSDRLVSVRHAFDRITVNLDAPARRGHAVATLDFNGKLGETLVSSLGLERIPLEYAGGSWRPVSGYAPQLAEVVAALEARRKAHNYRATAWFIRLERDEILVGEQLPKIPTRQLRLERQSGKLLFADGLR